MCCGRVLLEAIQYLRAAELGQHHVEKNDIWHLRMSHGYRSLTVFGCQHSISSLGKSTLTCELQNFAVFNQKYGRHCPVPLEFESMRSILWPALPFIGQPDNFLRRIEPE